MTILEHINKIQENLNRMVDKMDDDTDYYDATYHLEQIKEKVVQEPKTDYKAFAEWVSTEIFSKDWEYNKDSFAEIACRKLNKLGVVDTDGTMWIYENEALEQEPKAEWIPVSERLPELGERVLCQCQANIYDVLKLTVDGWCYNQDHCYMESFVIAWMPLPEPYKEDDMTIEDAKEYLKEIASCLGFTSIEEYTCKDGAKMREAIKVLEQEQKTGHWIEVIDEIDSLGNMTWHHECSICGKTGCGEHKYCPNCGCRMENNEN